MDLLKIAADLQVIVDMLRGNTSPPVENPADSTPAVPANWVRIRPPFPKGAVYRDYPDPQFVSNDGRQVETIGGYASQAQNAWGCSNFDYNTQGGRLMALGNEDNAAIKAGGTAAFPGILDRLAFPNDYVEKAVVDDRPWVPSERKNDDSGFEPVK